MPEEFYNHNRGRCPHLTPNRSNFFSDEHRAKYEAWYNGEIDPKDHALLIQFQAWDQAWKDWSKAHDDWNYMNLARCHGKWIALVKAWERHYTDWSDEVDNKVTEFIEPQPNDPA